MSTKNTCIMKGLRKVTGLLRRPTRYVLVCFLLFMSHYAAGGNDLQPPNFLPMPTSTMEFEATAYCDDGITKSGVPVARGIVAADPSILPLGSLIRLENTSYQGVYRVMDTGGLVKGKIIDIYMPGLDEALEFGRRKVQVIVLVYGSSKPGAPIIADWANPVIP
ncbi:MAG: hypothetical protein FJW35_06630 [Acidobacteria bacterium]|nr:hypothetical protein [Acidobacteriota bacterium]